MKRYIIFFLLVALVVLAETSYNAYGKVVYVSSSIGCDDNDGRTEYTPFKSITKGLEKGDTVLLRRGDVFFESITVASKYLGAYGDGCKPALYGWRRIIKPKWEERGKNVWSLCLTDDSVFAGYKVNKSSYENNIGCFYEYEQDAVHGRRVRYKKELRMDWDFWQTEKHKRSELSTSDFDSLYLYLSRNPNNERIGISVSSTAIVLANGTIDGVSIKGWGFGISAGSKSIIKNCRIDAIGGKQIFAENEFISYGNGIEFYVSSNIKDCLVENNYISRCYDCGVTIQASEKGQATPKNINVRNNLIERCCQGWEDFLRNDQNVVFENCVFENNIVLNSGNTSGFGYPDNRFKYCHVLGNNTKGDKGMIIRNNIFVGGNFYCSGAYNGMYKSNVWQDNICIIKRGDFILGNYNGNADVIRIPLVKGAFPTLKQATDYEIKRYRTLTGDTSTRFIIKSEAVINRKIKKQIIYFLKNEDSSYNM